MLRRACVTLGCLLAVGMATGGSSSAAPVGIPVNTKLPTLRATAKHGDRLMVSTGSWSGAPSTYSYAWRRCRRAVCARVKHATRPTYALGAADVGHRIVAVVTAHNPAGARSADTAASATVVSGPAFARPTKPGHHRHRRHGRGAGSSRGPRISDPIAIIASRSAG